MVINVGWVKDGKYGDVLNEIKVVKEDGGGKILKVIIETCLLTDDEKGNVPCRYRIRRDFIKNVNRILSGGAKERILLFSPKMSVRMSA